MHRRVLNVVLLGALSVGAPSFASGFYLGENGTKALLQGGAFTAQADDLTAIQHNPGGLALQGGVGFLFDSQLIDHQLSFCRGDTGVSCSQTTELVRNRGGAFFLPNLGGSYSLLAGGKRLTIALGVYGPPSVGKYQFNEPNYEKNDAGRYLEDPRRYAPNRYTLINNNVVIAFPSLSVGYELHPRVAVGVSMQYVYSNFSFRQAVSSMLITPRRQAEEDPSFDSIVSIDLTGKPSVTGILGVLARPTDSLSIGASVRPPVSINARGRFGIELGEAAQNLDTQVIGDQAELFMTLPWEARVGARFTTGGFALNADVVYEGWQSVQELVLVPEISTQMGTEEPKPVEPFHIPKKWHHSLSGRLGGSYGFGFGTTVYAGLLVEEGAYDEAYTSIDFLQPTRAILTLGAGHKLGGFEVIAGGAYSPTVSSEVDESEVRAGSTDPSVKGGVVGLGTYSSGAWIATLGLRGRFGGN